MSCITCGFGTGVIAAVGTKIICPKCTQWGPMELDFHGTHKMLYVVDARGSSSLSYSVLGLYLALIAAQPSNVDGLEMAKDNIVAKLPALLAEIDTMMKRQYPLTPRLE